MFARMTGQPGRSGRQGIDHPKRRHVTFRIDEGAGDMFDAAVAEAAKEVPRGMKFTASDYLRGLFLRDAEARGLTRRKERKGKNK